jgi:prepilin signal peptidase PulO-like enzyme (type II secretory pathway)
LNNLVAYFIAAFLGSAIGSFSYATALRMHSGADWVKGRSECDSCKHKLSWFDLLPVVGWLMLFGRCRYCHKRITIDGFVSEVASATILCLTLYTVGLESIVNLSGIASTVLFCLVATTLLIIFWYDYYWMIIPNKVVYPLIAFSVLFRVVQSLPYDKSVQSLFTSYSSSLYATAVLVVMFWGMFQLSKGKWIGYGDVRLAYALGLLSGSVIGVFSVLFIASLVGTLFAVPSLIKGKNKMSSQLPFGPLLIIGLVVYVLSQDWISSNFIL